MKTLKRIKVHNDVLEIRESARSKKIAVYSSHQRRAVSPWYASIQQMPLEIRRLFKAHEVRS